MEKIVTYTHKDSSNTAITANALVVNEVAAQALPAQPAGLCLVLVATDGSQDATALSQTELADGHPMVRRLAARSPTPGQMMTVYDPEASEPAASTMLWLDEYRVNILGIGA